MESQIISNLDYSRIKERVFFSKGLNPEPHLEMERVMSEFEKAKIIEPSEIPEDVVTMNSKIMIRDLNHNKTYTIQLVYPEDVDTKKNRVSIFSSLASALLGFKVGDVVNWNTPSETLRIKIEYILYQPESCGDYHL
jgi:regulator of nucleoside diphosphate kinase